MTEAAVYDPAPAATPQDPPRARMLRIAEALSGSVGSTFTPFDAQGMAERVALRSEVLSVSFLDSAGTELPDRETFAKRFRASPPVETRETFSASVSTMLSDLLGWKAGWNGYDAKAPAAGSVIAAATWLGSLEEVASEDAVELPPPSITASASGEVVAEWWSGSKKLTFYVLPDRIDFVKVWGPDMRTQMLDGTIASPRQALGLLSWLNRDGRHS